MSSRMSALKNKIAKLEGSFTLKFIKTLNKQIIELKQEGQCKQVSIDSLELLLDSANENIDNLNRYVKKIEDKKIKNRLKKLLVG